MSGSMSVLLRSVMVLGCIASGGTGCSLGQSAPPDEWPGPDVPLVLATGGPRSEHTELLVGYSSGRICRMRCDGDRLVAAWEAKLTSPVSCLAEVPTAQEATALLAGTSTGEVARFDGRRTEPTWQFRCTCEVASFAPTVDLDGDEEPEVLIGGADHRIHLLSGRSGTPIWSQLFESEEGDAYVVKVLTITDYDADGAPEVAVWTWGGELALLNGRTGKVQYRLRVSTGFSDAILVCQDLNGDGFSDFLVGGNDGTIRACSGPDGQRLWTGKLDRPIRDMVQPGAEEAGTNRPVYACTAGGEVARFDLGLLTESTPAWVARLGDVCRTIRLLPDVDRDGAPDVAVCAENGVVAVLSGATGGFLLRQQLGDAVRTVSPIVTAGRPCLTAASLDGAIAVLQVVPDHDPAAAPTAANPPIPGPPVRTQPGGGFAPAAVEPRVIILLYHDVVPELFYHYGVSVETFRAHLDMLRDEHYVCVSLDQIADWIEGKGGMPERAVCITFDGPYQGHWLYADPMLRERGWFATSYITTDWIGSINHADWHQLREMDAGGVMDIQNHSINHPYLTRCTPEEVRRQLAGCNEAIARRMAGKVVRHHAYPSGAQNDQVREVLRDLGFRTATTIVRRAVRKDDDLLRLPRYMVCTHTTTELFRSWLTGEATSTAPR